MSDHEKQTEFLRQCLLYADTVERQKLEESITRLQRNERCVRRALSLMILLAALAFAGLGYSAVFVTDFPLNMSRFITHLVTKSFCVSGLASVICMPVFLGLGAHYRKELNQRRDDCRQLAVKLLESRLGRPRTTRSPAVFNEPEPMMNHNKAVVSALETVVPEADQSMIPSGC